MVIWPFTIHHSPFTSLRFWGRPVESVTAESVYPDDDFVTHCAAGTLRGAPDARYDGSPDITRAALPSTSTLEGTGHAFTIRHRDREPASSH